MSIQDLGASSHGFQHAHIHPQILHFRQLGTGNIQPDQSGGEIQAFIGERVIDTVPVEKAVNRRKYCVPHRSQMKKHEEIHIGEHTMRCGIKLADKKQVK